MKGRPRANEMVRLRDRKLERAFGRLQWKVTARYTLQLSAAQDIECVRVRAFGSGGVGIVRHLSLSEFNRIFEAVKP